MLGHSIVSQHVMEPEGSIPNSQQLSTCSYPEPDQSSPHHSHTTSPRSMLMLSTHLCLGLPSGLFPSGYPTSNLSAFLFSPIRATWPAHLILRDLIILIMATLLMSKLQITYALLGSSIESENKLKSFKGLHKHRSEQLRNLMYGRDSAYRTLYPWIRMPFGMCICQCFVFVLPSDSPNIGKRDSEPLTVGERGRTLKQMIQIYSSSSSCVLNNSFSW
jgi:hypothetical protein